MKQILNKGRLEILIPEGNGGGLTGETHLVLYGDKKYVLRKCLNLSQAKYYEHLSNKFKKYNFLPKFLGRIGKNVFYEYIEGRDLKSKREDLKNITQVGKILRIINKYEFEGKTPNLFKKQLRELTSGKYKPSIKVQVARQRRNIKTKPKKILTLKQEKIILSYFNSLKKELNPKIVYECTDPTPGNFRIRKNKVYLVDIESIKPRYKGMGLSKFLLEWGKTNSQKKKFIEGYKNVKFISSKYKEFIDLNFLVQRLNFQVQTGKDYSKTLKMINRIK